MSSQDLPFERAVHRATQFHHAYEDLYSRNTTRTPTLNSHLDVLNMFVDQAHNGTFGNKKKVLVVSSTPGNGNSTVLTSFVDQRRELHYGEYVLAHWSECSENAMSLSTSVTRWVGCLGQVLGKDVTEWHSTNRKELEALISGTPSEQYLLSKFMRFINLALSSSKDASRPRSGMTPGGIGGGTDVSPPIHRIVIVVDGADRIFNHDGNCVLHWLPELLPEGCCVILSTTLQEKMNVKLHDVHHSDRAYPRELAMSEKSAVRHMMKTMRSLSQYEPLSVQGARDSPILREAIRRKYWMLSVLPLTIEDQEAMIHNATVRRASKMRLVLESVPRLRGILIESPEDLETREALNELLTICQTSLKRAPRPEEEEQDSSSQEIDAYLLSEDEEEEDFDDDYDDSDFDDDDVDRWWKKTDVRRLRSPRVLQTLIDIISEAVPGSSLRSMVTALSALRNVTVSSQQEGELLSKHLLSSFEESFEYASCLLDGNGLLVRPSTTTGDDFLNHDDNMGKSLFRFVVGTIGNARFGITRKELLGTVRECPDDTVQLSSTMRSYCLWLLRNRIMHVWREEPEVKPTQNRIPAVASLPTLARTLASPDTSNNFLAASSPNTPSSPHRLTPLSRSGSSRAMTPMTPMSLQQKNKMTLDDPRLWFETAPVEGITPDDIEREDAWDPRPQSPAQRISLSLFSQFKSMANEAKNEIRQQIRSASNLRSREHGGGLRKGRAMLGLNQRRNAVGQVPSHAIYEHHNMVEMLALPCQAHTLYTLLSAKEQSSLRRYSIQYYSLLPTCQRQMEELPWLYAASKKWLELKNILVGPNTFNVLWCGIGGLNRPDLVRWWTSVVKPMKAKNKKMKKNIINIDGYRLFNAFDVVEEYIEAIEHWSKMRKNNINTQKHKQTKNNMNNMNNMSATMNDEELIHRVHSFLKLCSNISDDRLLRPTSVVLPTFARELPPQVSDVIGAMNILLPLPTADMSMTTLFQSTTPNISLRSVDRMQRMTTTTSTTSTTAAAAAAAAGALSNFNAMGTYWWARFQWVQFPIFVMHRLEKQVHENKQIFDTLIENQEANIEMKRYGDSKRNDKKKKKMKRRNAIFLQRSGRTTGKKLHQEKKMTKHQQKNILPSPVRKSSSAGALNINNNSKKNNKKVMAFQKGEDPFSLLQKMMKKSAAGSTSKIHVLQKIIMEKKMKLNRFIVERKRYQKKEKKVKDRLAQCLETVKITENKLFQLKNNESTNSKSAVAHLNEILANVLSEHRQHLFLSQVVKLCGVCTGKSTTIEAENIQAIESLDQQMKETLFHLSKIMHDNKKKEKNVIPAYEKSIQKYTMLTKSTVHHLQLGADQLAKYEQEKKREQKRQTSIQRNVHLKARNAVTLINRKQTGATLMKALGLKMTKIEFKSGSRAISYKNAREKLHTLGIEDPMDLIGIIHQQTNTNSELNQQIKDMNGLKLYKTEILNDLQDDIKPRFQEEEEDNTLPTSTTTSTTSKNNAKRMTKVEKIENAIFDATKKLNRSRNKCKKSLYLLSNLKAGLLHLTKLLKMKAIHQELDNTGEIDPKDEHHRHHERSSSKNGGKMSQVIHHVLENVEDKLGQMVDMMNIVQKSKRRKRRSTSIGTKNGAKKESTSKGERGTSVHTIFWDPDNDPTLRPSLANTRDVGTPEYGLNGLVLPRRPISRCISMRLKQYDRGREKIVMQEEEDDEQAWWIDELDHARAQRLMAEKKKRKEQLHAQRQELERARKRQLQYEQAIAGKTANKQAHIDTRKLKREHLKTKKIKELERIQAEKVAKRKKKREEQERTKRLNFERLIRPKKKKTRR